MSAAAKAEAPTPAAAAPAAPPAKSPLVPILLAVILTGGAAGGGFFFYSKKMAAQPATADAPGHPAAPSAPAQYMPLQPPFVVNLADTEAARYLQVEMDVMTREAKTLDEVKNHLPAIRNALLLLLSQKQSHTLATREAKEALQAEVLTETNRVLEAAGAKPAVESIYFTSFVIQ